MASNAERNMNYNTAALEQYDVSGTTLFGMGQMGLRFSTVAPNASKEVSAPMGVTNLLIPQLDPIVVEQLIDVLSTHFRNGYRLDSTIEMTRFRDKFTKTYGKDLSLGDDELRLHIMYCGTSFDGKVYPVSAQTKKQIKEIAMDYFAKEAQIIFFSEFYAKNENWLFDTSVVSEKMLLTIFMELFPTLLFTQLYFGYTNAPIPVEIEKEILRVWGETVLLTYDQIAERLRYIPMERIKSVLSQKNDFIWNSDATYTHISRIDITEGEREVIRTHVSQKCSSDGYTSIAHIPFGEIVERNYELSTAAVHNAVYQICLSDKFDKNGKIIVCKGDGINAVAIIKEYCRTKDRCSLAELLNYEREMTGEVHQHNTMEACSAVLVRIDKDIYLADRYVRFNVDAIDEAIEQFVKGEYLPLRSFTTFGIFPDCGQVWNLFLLESYCRRFSQKFWFDAPAFNSKNAGAVIRTSCKWNYTEIMSDAVANANIPMDRRSVITFLYENGYIGKSATAKVDEIINMAKTIQMGGISRVLLHV